MEGQDNYFDEVTKNLRSDGNAEVSDFLIALKKKKEEAIRLKEAAERDDDEDVKKNQPSKPAQDATGKDKDGKQLIGKDGKQIPSWRPDRTHPAERFQEYFVDKGESIKQLQPAFRSMPRQHNEDLKQRWAFNDAHIGSDKYYPKFTSVQPNIAKQFTFSPNQIERRTLYFEGDPA